MDVDRPRRRQSPQAPLFEIRVRRLIEQSPLALIKLGYFNSLLFPLAVAERAASKLRGREDADCHAASGAPQ